MEKEHQEETQMKGFSLLESWERGDDSIHLEVLYNVIYIFNIEKAKEREGCFLPLHLLAVMINSGQVK